MNVAELKYEIDSSQAKTATNDLGKMSKAARDAENSQKGLGSTSTRAGRQIAAANDNIRTSSVATRAAFDALKTSIVSGLALIGPAIAAAFSVGPLFAFKDALAEVSTLVDTATFDMKALEEGALAQSAAFGGSAASQAKAYYSIISAGASSAAQATDILTASNKLAVGGVTDVATASDGLTSVLNAYGDKVAGAAAVSDALFVGMRAGKTTIGELSASLGKVAPLAAKTGVSFDELVAAISALTKGGISTNESVTGVRAILAAVAKPTSEASKLAKQLGIEFNSAGLQAKGFAGFMEDLVAKTGGNTDALAQLFGGVEALVPAMALAGQAGVDFAAIMEQMANKAGSTEEAFNKMAASPGFQAGRVWASLQAEVLGTAGAMSGPLTAALKAIADNMGAIVAVATIFTAGHLAAAIIPIIANLVALTSTLGAATVAARALSVAMAFVGGPIGLAVTGLAAAYLLLRDNVSAVEQATRDSETAYRNNIGLLNTAKASSEGYTAALRKQLEMQFEIAKQNSIMAGEAKVAAAARADNFERFAGFRFAPLDYDFEQKNSEYKSAFRAANALAEQLAEVDANMKTVTTSTTNAGLALGGAADKADKAKKSYADLIAHGVEFIANQNLERQAIGMTTEAANALRYEQELLNKAANDNIALTPKQTAELKAMAQGMAAAEAETSRLKEAFNFAKDVTAGFFSDLKSGLRSGEGFWKSFGNAAMGVLDKITDKLLNQVVDALFQVNSASSGIGGGGLFGSIFGGLGKILGFAKGTSYAPGGMAMVGEEGPELVELPRGSKVNTANETRRMLAPANANRGAANGPSKTKVTYAPTYNFTGTSSEMEEFKRQADRDRREFDAKVINAVQKGRQRSQRV